MAKASVADQLRALGATYVEEEDRWHHETHRQQWLTESPEEYLGWLKGYAAADQSCVDWRADPSADERWNAGVDYAQQKLCKVLGVNPVEVNWDAATETVDGDIEAVIRNILTLAMGERWMPEGARS